MHNPFACCIFCFDATTTVGNTYFIETTVTDINPISNSKCSITCDPHCNLILKKNHPDFANLYNKLQIQGTYRFEYKYKTHFLYHNLVITDIKPCIEHNITAVVKGILEINKEHNYPSNYEEIIWHSGDKSKRILISEHDAKLIEVGKLNKIYYKKNFGSNLYEMTGWKAI